MMPGNEAANVPVVGLTGGIGSGKSQAAEYFSRLGIAVVDADQCARVPVRPGMPALRQIAAHFGEEVLLPDGGLDRTRLREMVFADAAERHWLEALLHPLIGEEIAAQLRASAPPYALLMSPLLLETEQHKLCDRIVVVDVSEAVQLERASVRDKVSNEQIQAIVQVQMERSQRCAGAHHILSNEGSQAELQAAVGQLHAELLLWLEHRPATCTTPED